MKKLEKGFTLIELLVVIAIIAILVVIVVIAINPTGRIKDSHDRTASSNVHQAGTLITTCITKKIEEGVDSAIVYSNDATNGCADKGVLGNYGNYPTGIEDPAVNSTTNQICIWDLNAAGNGVVRFQSSTGSVEGPGAPADSSCPDV